MNNEEKIIELLTEIRDSLKKPEPKKRGKVFVKPTIPEVAVYCIQQQNNIDAKAFVDFYDSKNWYVGKNKMKDWKAAVRTWEKRNGSNGQGQNTGFDKRGRTEKVSDKLDEIAKRDIEQNGFTSDLGGGSV